MEWQPIETAPKDGTVVDLWMVSDDRPEGYREADAYWVEDAGYDECRYTPSGKVIRENIRRSGWWAPNHDYEGADGWADMPRWFNEHPRQKKWMYVEATRWMPLPNPPS